MEKNTLPSTIVEKDLNYYLRMIRGDFSEFEETHPMKVQASSSPKNIVILLTADKLGQGKASTGKRLLRFFFQSLINQQIYPRAVILTNSAVKLADPESEIYRSLVILEEQNVRVLICVLSAEEYGLEDKINLGVLSDMDSIVQNLLSAWKVITL